MKRTVLALSTLASLCLPCVVLAHPGHGTGNGFTAGVLHPVFGPDHVLAMIAVGLLAAQAGGRAIWLLPAAFVSMMSIGGLVNVTGVGVPAVEQSIAASVVVLGVMLACAGRVPLYMTSAIVGLFALFHGFAHVAEAGEGHSVALYGIGFLLSTAFLHAVGIGLGLLAKKLAPEQAIRIGGGAIAMIGVILFTRVI